MPAEFRLQWDRTNGHDGSDLRSLCRFALALILTSLMQTHAADLTGEFPLYTPAPGVSGSLKSVGSDTMNNVMTLWQEGFREEYPNVQTQVEGKGSSTAPPALISGTANFGPMSRAMKDAEIAAFKKKFGYEPTGLKVGIDVLAVFVHRDNPIAGLSMVQLDAIFSKGRRAGHLRPIRTWGDLGLPDPWATKPITLYGRNSASGTYGYFKEFVLLGGTSRMASSNSRKFFRRPSSRYRSLCHRVFRHRLPNAGCPRASSIARRQVTHHSTRCSVRVFRQVSAFEAALGLRRSRTRQTSRPAPRGIHSLHVQQARTEGGRPRRLPTHSAGRRQIGSGRGRLTCTSGSFLLPMSDTLVRRTRQTKPSVIWIDRITRVVITLGGIGTIAAVIAVAVFSLRRRFAALLATQALVRISARVAC